MNAHDFKKTFKECKSMLRILDNYHVPENIRLSKVRSFLLTLNHTLKKQYGYLVDSREEIFGILLRDALRQNGLFIEDQTKTIADAQNLLRLNLKIEKYLYNVDSAPWVLGRKLNHFEKFKIRSAMKKVFHKSYDPKTNRPMRGTKVYSALTGSLSTGYSDWKLINGGDIPKPSDYGIPREYRSRSKSVLRRIDDELMLPEQLRQHFSDVDLLIVNKVLFDSTNVKFKPWSCKLGEKYDVGLGGSPILEQLHKRLRTMKIGGARGRWVNYIILPSEKEYGYYLDSRKDAIATVHRKTNKDIKIIDNIILDGIIH